MRYPILYKSTETDFENNGIGILSDCMKCTISESLNGAYELKMQYPISGIHYESIARRSIIKASVNAISAPQLFRIYSVTRSMSGIANIFAEHISYDLSGIPVSTFTANNAPNALIGLKNNAVSACPFTFWTDKSNYGDFVVAEPGSIRSQLGGKEGSILDIYGGEYEFDNFQVKLHNRRGYDRGVTIRYGKNLTNLEQDENCTSCYTAVYPYWISQNGDLVELPEKVVNAPGTYDYERIMTLNLSQDFEEAPSEEQLRQRAARYIEDNDIGVPKVSWKISYLDLEKSEEYRGMALLERVLLGDTVSVEFPSMGVSASARVVAYEYDALLERNANITLGSVKADITDTIAEQKKETENMVTPSLVQSIASTLTATILGAKGGSVRILDENNDGMPDTLYVADNPNPADAKKVWRWNYEGWAGSQNGYNGPFELGATLDDGILAKSITAANLVAGTIKSQDGDFCINLDTGYVRIKAVSDLQSAQENLRIGGRNLLLGTETFTGWGVDASGSGQQGTLTIGEDGTATVVNQDQNTRLYTPNLVPASPGVDYTVSVKYRHSSGEDTFQFQITTAVSESSFDQIVEYFDSDGVTKFRELEDGWKLAYFTFRLTDPNSKFMWIWLRSGLDGELYNQMFELKQPMLEIASTPSDWSPAPEDVASSEKVASLEIDVNGIRTSVSNVEKSVDDITKDGGMLDVLSEQISTVEQTAESVTVQVSQLRIGGKNLLFGTEKFTAWSVNASGSGKQGDATFEDGIVTITNNGQNTRLFPPNDVAASPNVDYTVSVKYRHLSGDDTFQFQILTAESESSFNSLVEVFSSDGVTKFRELEDGWKLAYFTFQLKNAKSKYMRIGLRSGLDGELYNQEFEIKQPMLEIANTPSDWSPASEDTASKMASLEIKADGIIGTVSETYVAKSDFNDYKKIDGDTNGTDLKSVVMNHSASISQKADAVTITAIQEATKANGDQLSDFKAHFRFDANGEYIGKEGSDTVTKFANDRWSFLISGSEQLYVDPNGVYGRSLQTDSLSIGNLIVMEQPDGDVIIS